MTQVLGCDENAHTIEGFSIDESANASTIVKRNSVGSIFANWIHMSGATLTTPTPNSIFVETDDDGYIRTQSVAQFKSNLDLATNADVATAVAGLVDSSPTTLDTLNELAAALGDDPNFATTVTNQIGTKLDADAQAVDSAKLNGKIASVTATNDTIVQRHSSGYIYANYFNSTGTTAGSPSHVMVQTGSDGFHRREAVADFISNLNLLTTSGKAADSEKLDGLDSTAFVRSDTSSVISGVVTHNASVHFNVADAIFFEAGKHAITYNDGQGNFNIRVGHVATDLERCTEAGYCAHTEWSQTSGTLEWLWSNASMNVNDVITWGATLNWKYDGTLVLSGGSTSGKLACNTIEVSSTAKVTNLNADSVDGYHVSTASAVSSIPARDASGDIYARLFRSTYGVTSSVPATTAEIVFRNNSTDNYHRTMTSGAFKSWCADVGIVTTSEGKATDSDKLDGYQPATADTGSTIMLREPAGDARCRYMLTSYVNMSHGSSTRSTDSIFYSSYDNYIRKNTASGFKASLNLNDCYTVAPKTLTVGEMRQNLRLRGQQGGGTFTLPKGANGLSLKIFNRADGTNYLRINANAADKFRFPDGSLSALGGYIRTNEKYNDIEIFWDGDDNVWHVIPSKAMLYDE